MTCNHNHSHLAASSSVQEYAFDAFAVQAVGKCEQYEDVTHIHRWCKFTSTSQVITTRSVSVFQLALCHCHMYCTVQCMYVHVTHVTCNVLHSVCTCHPCHMYCDVQCACHFMPSTVLYIYMSPMYCTVLYSTHNSLYRYRSTTCIIWVSWDRVSS